MSLSNKELLDKTLFLKDSVLFISMDGKEYEVSNPEEFTGGLPIEWTGGVEMIKQFRPKGGIVWHKFSGLTKSKESGYEFRTVARLLPKEKKIYNPALSGYKPESDYKQFERKREPCAYEEECQHPACNCGKMIEPFIKECPKCRTKDFASCHSMHCPVRKPVDAAPVESQEELSIRFGEWLRKNEWCPRVRSDIWQKSRFEDSTLTATTKELFEQFTRLIP